MNTAILASVIVFLFLVIGFMPVLFKLWRLPLKEPIKKVEPYIIRRWKRIFYSLAFLGVLCLILIFLIPFGSSGIFIFPFLAIMPLFNLLEGYYFIKYKTTEGTLERFYPTKGGIIAGRYVSLIGYSDIVSAIVIAAMIIIYFV